MKWDIEHAAMQELRLENERLRSENEKLLNAIHALKLARDPVFMKDLGDAIQQPTADDKILKSALGKQYLKDPKGPLAE